MGVSHISWTVLILARAPPVSFAGDQRCEHPLECLSIPSSQPKQDGRNSARGRREVQGGCQSLDMELVTIFTYDAKSTVVIVPIEASIPMHRYADDLPPLWRQVGAPTSSRK